MYSATSQFDGNAAFSGGGFMPPSQATQAADSSFSSSKSNRDAQALMPLTVKQINEALLANVESNNFAVDGVDVNNVTIFGIVCDKAEKVTEVGFTVDDGTGRINVHRWVNEPHEANEMEKVRDGIYVRVHGTLKGFQGKRQLVAFAVRPVTDFNELTFHFLECMYVHLYNTKMRAASVSADPQMNPSVNGTPLRGYQVVQQNQFSDWSGEEQMVLDYLRQPANVEREAGVPVDELMQRLNKSRDKIMASVLVLENEGQIYSTIDEEHYRSTING